MNRFDHRWQKLIALARLARDDRDTAAPHGFAMRVCALAADTPVAGPWSSFERFALRGLLVAAAFGMAAIAFNYPALLSEQPDDYVASDAVSEMFDLS